MSVRTCPKCGADTKVYDSRATVTGNILRRRKCLACEFRFNTLERYTGPVGEQMEAKRDGV